jgi:hypothetical protein
MKRELTELFRRLGARTPTAWANSQVDEGIPQLARFLFLRQSWKLIVGDNDHSWISARMRDKATDPGGEIGASLSRLQALGASESDLTTVVRVMQWRLLFGFCQLLNDPGNLEDEVKNVAWQLYQIDEDDQPTVALASLHESVLETDPTGREMRAK